jgi:hypothetical protein
MASVEHPMKACRSNEAKLAEIDLVEDGRTCNRSGIGQIRPERVLLHIAIRKVDLLVFVRCFTHSQSPLQEVLILDLYHHPYSRLA